MTIVCGTDLSPTSHQAARAAAAIARRLAVPLKLVHVGDPGAPAPATGRDPEARPGAAGALLQQEARDLSLQLGVEVEALVVPGVAHDALLDVARDAGARLLVVSSLGAKKQHRWLLGSTAERVAQASPIPVLVVREAAGLEAWARGDRPLRVMVAVEIAPTSRAALRWAAALREVGPCDLLVTQVVWPPGEHQRLGVGSPVPLDHLRPELLEPLTRDLRAWVGELPGAGETRVTVTPGWGRVDTHLTLLAAEAAVDLLVVGTHQRAGVARLWQGSVSRGVLHAGHGNVAAVPRSGAEAEVDGDVPATLQRILVPTDLSPLANRAVPVAYGMAPPGGTVHLLHVVTRKPGEDDEDPAPRLRALVPRSASARGITTAIEVVRESDAGVAIARAAARLGVDAICMATHGRSGVSRVVLGSQAQGVVERSRQPVILVPPERDD